jgi:DNA (cytosine-5)-methyltransferase 1
MSKPRLLDLFCGAGGATKGYQRAGFYVVGVDIKPQPHYCGDEFYQADALTFPLKDFDSYHASPPCQRYSRMQNIHHNYNKHPDLIVPTRNRLLNTEKPFVIENVINAPIRIDLMLCGTMFGLRIPKHRIFESNIPMPILTMMCNHIDVYDPFHGGEMARGERIKYSQVLGIDWFMTRQEVREAIPPAYTEYIGKYLIKEMANDNL